MLRSVSLALLACLAALPLRAQQQDSLVVIVWNVESGGADPDSIAAAMLVLPRADVWGFAEVQNGRWARRLEAAAERRAGTDYVRIVGRSGGGDRLAVLVDAARFEVVRRGELAEINIRGAVRAPLVAHLRERRTGRELLFMMNHLYRGDAAGRLRQAVLLNRWVRSVRLPVVAAGDYNFDWDVREGDRFHDPGYDSLTAGGAFRWVRPETLVTTHCSRYDDVLDFVFVAGAAQRWPARSRIVARRGDCPDSRAMPDHRPVVTRFTLPPARRP